MPNRMLQPIYLIQSEGSHRQDGPSEILLPLIGPSIPKLRANMPADSLRTNNIDDADNIIKIVIIMTMMILVNITK